MPPRKAPTKKATARKATTTTTSAKVPATRSFRPDSPELVYVVIEGAVLDADDPAVAAHPTHFGPVK